MTKTFDVVALGEAMVEFNQTRAGEPHYLQGFGGDTSNAVIAAARAGARTAYLTRIGQDKFGDELMALWGITQAVALCDIFLPSVDDVTALSGLNQAQAIVDWGHALGAKTVVLKLGGEGCLASDGARREQLPGHKVKVADATGAGDCYCGNLLARLAAGDTVFEAARYANAAAALAVQGFGAVAPLPRPEQVRALL